jgi:2-polyprenyl-6-methoxyphenol hydroxylase-like FAD-dependent oxidoreductase
MPAVERVLILGGGISGLTLGIALRRAGIEVEILEVRHEIGAQAGIGLSLQGNALAALARVGLVDACIAQGVPANHINIRGPDGTLLAHQPVLRMGGEDLPATLGISRTLLHQILLRAGDEAGITLRSGVTVEHVAMDADGVDLRLTDGSRRRAGLLVGADGIYSKTRALVHPQVKPQPCGQAVWRAAVPRPSGCDTTELHFGGPLGAVGICPRRHPALSVRRRTHSPES